MVCVVSIRRGVLPSVSLRSVHAVLLVSCFWILWVSFWCESEVAQSCPTLSDPMDCSLPGSSIHGIFQAGVLEWGAIAFSEF